MASYLTAPSSFVAATKAKASEVNSKFTAIYNALVGGTNDININGIFNNRLSNGNVDITANACYFAAYPIIDSATTYSLRNSSSRMVVLGDLTVNAGGTIDTTAGAEILIV